MSNQKTHWRDALHKEYLHGSELTKPINVTVEGFSTIEVYSQKSRDKEELVVLHFQEPIKSLILTGRKAAAMEIQSGSAFLEDWAGTKVSLSAVEEKHFGQIMPVIQVGKALAEKKKPVLDQKSKQWAKAVKALEDGTTKVDQILPHYTVSEADIKVLESKVKKATPKK